MPKLLFDMQTGVAGDMILGALFDAGLDFDAWKAGMQGLRLAGVELSIEKVRKHGLMATRFHAHVPDSQHHRGLAEIRSLIEAAELPGAAASRALSVFGRLAEVEAAIHGVPIEAVHFHEVGALDAIVDVVGACLGFEMLGVDGFYTTPFTFGSGTVRTAHGELAVPVPATLALSRGFPSVRTGLRGELCTPTGTALITAFAEPVPPGWAGVLRAEGYGAGSKDLPGMANVLRICLMDDVPEAGVDAPGAGRNAPEAGKEAPGPGAAASGAGPGEGGMGEPGLFQVECNLDNMAPELLGYALERLFEAGCKDAWQEPIQMKKNRSAVKLCALVEAPDLDRVLSVVAAETSTGGMRWFPVRRWVARKGSRRVDTPYGSVEMKEATFPGQPPRLTPEYESCRALALQAGAPLQDVYRAALAAAQAGRRDA
jgi:uncharacterized protein (TIGR00299 family) protein